ncbi:hypothetical protein AVEN_168222-1 [Araneus ventricosus]|uniref:Uncharacterized protein n=1 Tax=Araneus ventricosus TaxID=182803 RepID=A0A4Y2UFI6_ARAVE|nr:hypothetical protein AVEN_166331-1 [Araneus ventricosus]GBO10330.1 hypothetical protein AVEN_168222-1 [Araneus ventricosus]
MLFMHPGGQIFWHWCGMELRKVEKLEKKVFLVIPSTLLLIETLLVIPWTLLVIPWTLNDTMYSSTDRDSSSDTMDSSTDRDSSSDTMNASSIT